MGPREAAPGLMFQMCPEVSARRKRGRSLKSSLFVYYTKVYDSPV
jgi:hypothetical protein